MKNNLEKLAWEWMMASLKNAQAELNDKIMISETKTLVAGYLAIIKS